MRASLLLGLLSLVALLSALASPTPGRAIFHIALIDEVLSGFGGDADVQYVEIRMDFPGQNLVEDTRLTVYNSDGSTFDVLLLLPNDVPNGQTNLRWIMATQAFADLPQVHQAGFTPDFIFPLAPGIPTPSGMVCWGAPDTATDPTWDPEPPFNYTDCVAYGGYTGGDSPHPPASALPPGDGTKALQRVLPPPVETTDLTRLLGLFPSDADAFELRCPTPENNAGEVVLLGADDDADGLPNCHEEELGTNPAVVDTDQDGCADGEEAGRNVSLGGRRDPLSFWDFYDVPVAGSPRNQIVNAFDIGALVLRFGAFVQPPPTKEEALAQALTLPSDATSYHAAFDRGGPIPGEDLWDLLPPDGAINAFDIGSVVVQFGHTCSAPP